MTDLEMTKLSAEAMGREFFVHDSIPGYWENGIRVLYDPLHDDAQAMELAKKFLLRMDTYSDGEWLVDSGWGKVKAEAQDRSLNRAIVECVAKMQAERATA
jgi:hypothetical protein